MAVASTFSRASPGPGSGIATSRTSVPARPPSSPTFTTARIESATSQPPDGAAVSSSGISPIRSRYFSASIAARHPAAAAVTAWR